MDPATRDEEFVHAKGVVYVDHAGATLYSRSQLDAVHRDLTSHLYGNPHSGNPSSLATAKRVEQVRNRILAFFNTTSDDYSVVFTSGATAALKLVAEGFRTFQHHPKENVEDAATLDNSDFLEHKSVTSSNPWFMYLDDNHTSVLGMREVFAYRGAVPLCVEPKEVNNFINGQARLTISKDSKGHSFGKCEISSGSDNSETSMDRLSSIESQGDESPVCVRDSDMGSLLPRNTLSEGDTVISPVNDKNDPTNSLFVFPAQSNFSGRKYPLSWIQGMKHSKSGVHGNWYTVLDAAGYVSTSHLDLSRYQPDFVTVSFYKIFGYPTGLGALIVKNTSAHLLQKRYFGGGTIQMALPRQRIHQNKSNISDRFEDGTIAYLDILALNHGFDTLQRLAGSIHSISLHTFSLAQWTYKCLSSLTHPNGRPVVKLYHDSGFTDQSTQGPVVNFNVLHPDGTYIGYAQVDKLAQVYHIHLRTGCFCNLPACQRHLAVSDDTIIRNFEAGHVCGDDKDLIDGHPTGSVRVSYGYMSTHSDALALVKFVMDSFMEHPAGDLAPYSRPLQETPPLPCHALSNHHNRIDQSAIMLSSAPPWDKSVCSGLSDYDREGLAVKRESSSVAESATKPDINENSQTGLNSGHSQRSTLHSTDKHSTLSEQPSEDQRLNKLSVTHGRPLELSGCHGNNQLNSLKSTDNFHDTTDPAVSNLTNKGIVSTEISSEPKDSHDQGVMEIKHPISQCQGNNGAYSDGENQQMHRECVENVVSQEKESNQLHLKSICLYPVKSCGVFKVSSWELNDRGFMYDRAWMIVDSDGVCLTQKREPLMCRIKPSVDLQEDMLILKCEGLEPLAVPIKMKGDDASQNITCRSKVCVDRVDVTDCGEEAADWVSLALETSGCRLRQQNNKDDRKSRIKGKRLKSKLSLANEAQYLLISEASVCALHDKVRERSRSSSDDDDDCPGFENLLERFRANMVISGGAAFEEEKWKKINIGNNRFEVCAQCDRCQVICTDQNTGRGGKEPLRSLGHVSGRKFKFGMLLSHLPEGRSARVTVGDIVEVIEDVRTPQHNT